MILNEGDSCSYLKNMTILSSICQHTYLNWYNSLKVLCSDAVEPPIQFGKKSNTNNIQNAVPPASGIPESASIHGLSFNALSHPFNHGRSPLPQGPVNSNGVCIIRQQAMIS
jgi:hypothetical protein